MGRTHKIDFCLVGDAISFISFSGTLSLTFSGGDGRVFFDYWFSVFFSLWATFFFRIRIFSYGWSYVCLMTRCNTRVYLSRASFFNCKTRN